MSGRLSCPQVVGAQLMKFKAAGYFPKVHLLSQFPNLADVMMDSPSILGSPPFFFLCVCGMSHCIALSIYMHILQIKCFKIVLMKLNSKMQFRFFT